MNKLKRTLIIGAGVASVGVAGLTGVATTSALTASDNSTGTSLIDKLVTKFNLNKDEVEAVFQAERAEHKAEMKAERSEALKMALNNGKLTQAQYDYILNAHVEIDALIEAAGSRDEQSDEEKAAIKEKFEALRGWFKEQDLNLRDLGIGRGHGGGGFGNHDAKE
jgi:hypothetical protein